MRVAIHNVEPAGEVSDEAFAALEQKVAKLKGQVAALPETIETAVSAALRPVAAEIALREKEQRAAEGMRTNRATNVHGTFRLPAGDAA